MQIAVLTGAGISAESGLRTFRDSEDGLWEGYDIQDVATPDAWNRNPQLVLEFYNWRRAEARKAQPNKAHIRLAEAEEDHELYIITQNVDDLHERAGSSRVLHIHGELNMMCSEKNRQIRYPISGDIQLGQTAEDGAQLRPDIVWFGEAVPQIDAALDIVRSAEALIIIGTSLVVYPAAGLLNYLPATSAVYVLDPNIPEIARPIHAIHKKATEGIEELLSLI